MLIVSLCAFSLFLFLIIQVAFWKADVFSPARLYLLFHSLTLGIAFLALHPAMVPFKPLTSIVYFGSSATFLLGIWIAGMLEIKPSASQIRAPSFGSYNWKWHMVFSGVLVVIFAYGMLAASAGAGGLPLLAENKQDVLYRFNRVSYTSAVAYNLGATAMALLVMPALLPGIPRFVKWAGLAAAAAASLFFVMTLNRIGIVFFVFFTVAFYHQSVKRISPVRLALLFAVFFSFFLTIAYFKLGEMEKKYSLKLDRTEFILKLMTVPYAYVANNYWNLDYALNPENSRERHPTTYGFTTVQGFLDAMSLPGGNLGIEIREGGGYEDMFHEPSIKTKGLNTIPYQWGLYKDFGVAGTLILPFLFGIAIKVLYLRVRLRATVLNLAMYSNLAFFIAFSWFTAMWELVTFVLGLLYLALCCGWCQSLKLGAPGAPVSPNSAADAARKALS